MNELIVREYDKYGCNKQRHILRWTIPGPDSSYSCLEHQRFWKVESEAKIEPPIQTEYFLSGGATILT